MEHGNLSGASFLEKKMDSSPLPVQIPITNISSARTGLLGPFSHPLGDFIWLDLVPVLEAHIGRIC